MMIRAAVCDDDPAHLDSVLSLFSTYQAERSGIELLATCFRSSGDVLSALRSGKVFDVFFLDIIMPGQSGIELARHLRSENEEAHIVFLSSSADYALDAFGVYATQYIVKPARAEKLFPVLDKIAAAVQRFSDDYLIIPTTDREVKIPFSAIVFLESAQRKLKISLTDGNMLISRSIRVPLEQAVAPLLEDSRFLHAHKSYVLNMELVEELTAKSFIMKDGGEIFIPKYKYSDAKNRYMEYLSAQNIRRLGGFS